MSRQRWNHTFGHFVAHELSFAHCHGYYTFEMATVRMRYPRTMLIRLGGLIGEKG